MTSGHSTVTEHKEHALTKWDRVAMAISLIVCKIHKAYLDKVFLFIYFFVFLLWWKLEALSPDILHQTIYNLCKICMFENTFFHYRVCYEYSKISSLYF